MNLFEYFISIGIVLFFTIIGNIYCYIRFGFSLVTKINILITYVINIVSIFTLYFGLKSFSLLRGVIFAIIALFLLLIPVIWYSKRFIIGPIEEVRNELRKIKEGKLKDQNIIFDEKDEFGKLFADLFEVKKNLKSFIKLLNKEAENQYQLSGTLTQSSQNIDSNIKDIRIELNELLNKSSIIKNFIENDLNSLSRTKDQIDKNISKAKEIKENIISITNTTVNSSKLAESAIKSLDIIKQSTDNSFNYIQELNEQYKKIPDIINYIQQISEQTNLLALNAAIEAARAGDVGKGFAVVAEEIRKLAEQSKDSTDQISSLIMGMTGKIKDSASFISKTYEEVKNSSDNIRKTLEGITEIKEKVVKVDANFSEFHNQLNQNYTELLKGADERSKIDKSVIEIREKISEISQLLNQSYAFIKSLNELSNRLNENSNNLKESIKRFDV